MISLLGGLFGKLALRVVLKKALGAAWHVVFNRALYYAGLAAELYPNDSDKRRGYVMNKMREEFRELKEHPLRKTIELAVGEVKR